jgi:glutamate carboxypeptidase
MVHQLASLVESESPSSDLRACRTCADVVATIGGELLGEPPDSLELDGHTHLRWRFGPATRVVLVGHFDTVWPAGTTARWPFAVDADGVATGPGAFDMKAGIVQAFHALSCLADLAGVALVLTSDEEIGSPSSRALIEESATGAAGALVLEPSAGGALKIARKGTSNYVLVITGKAAHAGLEPEKGVNATVELAHQVVALQTLGRIEVGTTVTPTVAGAGTTSNTVPGSAFLHIDVRIETLEKQERVDAALRDQRAQVPGAALFLRGGPNRPPLPATASAALMERAGKLAGTLGLGDLAGVAVGGGSDGNFTAGIGVPTLDGLGAVGDGAHAEGEHVLTATMPERAALLALLVEDVLGN